MGASPDEVARMQAKARKVQRGLQEFAKGAIGCGCGLMILIPVALVVGSLLFAVCAS